MKRPGPLLTLLAGLLLGVFLLVMNATTGTKAASYGSGATTPTPSRSASASPTASTAPSSASSPSHKPVAAPDASYAGRTDDGSSAVAVTVRDRKAIAYFCDGRAKESWLKGDVRDDGTMTLTGAHGDVLRGTLRGGAARIRGTAEVGGDRYAFTAARAHKPSGLWRTTATVRGAKLVGGWVVLPGGRQVGVVTRDGSPSAAPPIDPTTGAVTVDGQRLTARPATP
ncbi:hypothetical protein [Streptomyces mangrovisoli]|uniref:Uncharacterized protein n=1 Tax=Streptomyces mangrovisoli TaxID=1428628 RepID=A0A1J4NP18_9ACTN|nr:hypothetical protein [Streptomyces mangrovisoli]OIJ64177.1 hypothetical protein WN71_030450 [Streptomyces mangrovisoli]